MLDLYRAIDRWMRAIAVISALAGGFVLIALVLMTTVSITGRALVFAGLGPIPGDFELVEAGTAFAIFAFLPWCQYNRGHASVEVFTSFLPERINDVLLAIGDVLLFAIAVLITSRLWLGLNDKIMFGETTFVLQFPLWWAYAAAFAGACVFTLVSAWCALRALIGLVRPELAPAQGGALH